MLPVAILFASLMIVAVLSAFAAYRLVGSAAWEREYNDSGMGLTIELAFLFLTAFAMGSISLIMQESFEWLFRDGGWQAPAFLIAAAAIGVGVCTYMLVFAPRILAEAQQVAPERMGRECRLPYLAYTPFSLISWIVLVLPLVAMIVIAVHTDRNGLAEARLNLMEQGTTLVAVTTEDPGTAIERNDLYGLAYRDAVDQVQRMVSRYLWVVGVFMVFMVIILNTRITSIFTETAQDSFKWLMWVLLLLAMGICVFGLLRYQVMRQLAVGVQDQILSIAEGRQQFDLMATSKFALLDLRSQGPVHFLRMALEGGGWWLLFFSYVTQIVLAKITDRSVVKVIFPRPVAEFLDAFMLSGEDDES